MQWYTYSTLSLVFWGISPICATLCLTKYGLVTSQWQLLDTATKVVTAILLQQVVFQSSSREGAPPPPAVRPWLQLPLYGVLLGILDGALGGLAAWCQGQALQLQQVRPSTIVAFTSLFPVVTKLLSIVVFGEECTAKHIMGILAACFATACFAS